MNARLRLAAVLAIALPGLAVQAQSHLRAGLWEEKISAKTDNAQMNAAQEQMKERLAAMTPEQRAAMEKAMSAHGMAMGAPGGPTALRVCITKEQAERDFTPDSNGHCTRTDVVRSGNTTRFNFACGNGKTTINGDGVFTQMGDSAFAVSTNADTTMHGGPTHIHSEIAGKFVSSDCGNVKPVVTPPPAH
jgi:hypothetical protein